MTSGVTSSVMAIFVVEFLHWNDNKWCFAYLFDYTVDFSIQKSEFNHNIAYSTTLVKQYFLIQEDVLEVQKFYNISPWMLSTRLPVKT